MSGINFLDNKKYDDQKPKDNKKDKPIWSNPKKEIKVSKSFSFFPFISKPADKNSASIINKNKIKESREEILNLIKHHENSKPPLKEKGKNFFAALGEKLRKQPGPKEVLIDYQRIFNQEKEHKNQVGNILNIKPAKPVEKSVLPAIKKPENDWFKRLAKSFKSKMIALNVHKNETAKIIKLSKVEEVKPAAVKPPAAPAPIVRLKEKPAEIKEIKIEAKEPKNEIRQRVIETNLIQEELITFFDWHSKIVILASVILMPIFIVIAFYYGLVFYQKSSQAKNLAQAQKFAELKKSIAKEESGLDKILGFEAQLKTVSQVFSQHLYWTNFFKFLEDNTIKNVYFVDFEGDTGGDYTMDALADDYSGIAEQINVFRNNKKITAVLAEGGEMVVGDDANKTLVKFALNFSVLKSLFTE